MECGWSFSTPSPQPLGYVDPLPDDVRPADEDPEGVPLYWHPTVLQLHEPELEWVLDRYRVGALRSLTLEDCETLSYFERECVLILQGVADREERRQWDAMKPSTGGDDVDGASSPGQGPAEQGRGGGGRR